jgi:hypothetical protein
MGVRKSKKPVKRPLFIGAANFTPADRTLADIWYLVVHDEEAPDKPDMAEDIANFFHNQAKSPEGTSAHRAVDDNSIVHCVKWTDVAWAAPGANTNGMHWEQSGYVSETRDKWKDPYGLAMMEILAKDMAAFAKRAGIPIVRLTPGQIAENYHAGKPIHRGICGHDDITAAHISPYGTHTDPGPNYPWHHLLARIDYYKKGGK